MLRTLKRASTHKIGCIVLNGEGSSSSASQEKKKLLNEHIVPREMLLVIRDELPEAQNVCQVFPFCAFPVHQSDVDSSSLLSRNRNRNRGEYIPCAEVFIQISMMMIRKGESRCDFVHDLCQCYLLLSYQKGIC